MTGLGYINLFNAGDGTITDTGKLYARGDFLNGPIVSGGFIAIASSGAMNITGVIDVTGNPGGTIVITSNGTIGLQNGSQLLAKGSKNVDTDIADGGDIDVTSLMGVVGVGNSAGGTIVASGSGQGAGGAVNLQAAGAVNVLGPIDVTSTGSDGGDVFVVAGDDISVTKTITADSGGGGGSGGTITLDAGEDELGGASVGGGVTVDSTTLNANGASLGGVGGIGGDILVTTSGPIVVTSTATLRVNAGPDYDGDGGTVTFDSSDDNTTTLGPLDGDITVNGNIVAYSGQTGGVGGRIAFVCGRSLTIAGSIATTGHDGGGQLDADAGTNVLLNGQIQANASNAVGAGGSINVTAGHAADATLTVAQSIVDSAGSNATGSPSIVLAACSLVVNSAVTVDAESGAGATGPAQTIQLISKHPMQLGLSSHYLAAATDAIATIHPAGANPIVGASVVFSPSRSDEVVASGVYPECPVP